MIKEKGILNIEYRISKYKVEVEVKVEIRRPEKVLRNKEYRISKYKVEVEVELEVEVEVEKSSTERAFL